MASPSLAEANRTIREAVAARMAATSKDDPKMQGYFVVQPQGTTPTASSEPVAREPKQRFVYRPVIGLAGNIGAGKTIAAGMIPGAVCFQWADPLYASLAAMLDVDESALRDRDRKDAPMMLGSIEVSPRRLLQTLGTDWGRDIIHPDLWVELTLRRVDAVPDCDPVAICGTRFANEVNAIRNLGGEVWWIDRPGSEPANKPHIAERSIGPQHCNAVILNDGSLDTLRERIAWAWADYTAGMKLRC